MKRDPISGPLSRDELAELVKAPFGKAVEKIRDADFDWDNGDEMEILSVEVDKK